MTRLLRSIIAPLMVLSISTAPAFAADPTTAVSPMMQDLVRTFVEKSIYLAAVESLGETEMVGTVVQERFKALAALTFHEPQNLTEFAMKTSALVEFSEDTERWSIRILVEDAARLAEAK